MIELQLSHSLDWFGFANTKIDAGLFIYFYRNDYIINI